MRKLLLGIVAVLCVQITFQIFTAVDRSDEKNRALMASGPLVAPVTTPGDPAVDVIPEPNDVEVASSRTNLVVHKRAALSIINPAPATPVREQPAPLFKPVTIVAMAPKPPLPGEFSAETVSRTAYLATKERKRTGKRSLFSKALPVLKKPYDWLKAVASKVD